MISVRNTLHSDASTNVKQATNTIRLRFTADFSNSFKNACVVVSLALRGQQRKYVVLDTVVFFGKNPLSAKGNWIERNFS
jgi:hypothetical protein